MIETQVLMTISILSVCVCVCVCGGGGVPHGRHRFDGGGCLKINKNLRMGGGCPPLWETLVKNSLEKLDNELHVKVNVSIKNMHVFFFLIQS